MFLRLHNKSTRLGNRAYRGAMFLRLHNKIAVGNSNWVGSFQVQCGFNVLMFVYRFGFGLSLKYRLQFNELPQTVNPIKVDTRVIEHPELSLFSYNRFDAECGG